MATANFFRVGQPVRVPFTASSASNQFPLGLSPEQQGVSDLSFMFVNPTPYDVRLEGTPAAMNGQMSPFQAVTASTGWLIPARTTMGPFTSKKPMAVSCQAFTTPGAPLTGSEDFTGCAIELIYGRGS